MSRVVGSFTLWGLLLCAGCAEEPVEPLHSTSTDIFIADLETIEGRPAPGRPVNLTNRPGYDNQPAFTPDGRGLLYASADDVQVDCYRYDLEAGRSERLTDTPEREYSPLPVPGRPGFSVVRVEQDASQRLWEFGDDGREPLLLLEWEDDVGYYVWLDPALVALRLQDDPTELRFADTDVGWAEQQSVETHIGRSLRLIPGRNAMSFVHMAEPEQWWIVELDLLTRESRRIVGTLPGREDHAWTPDGTLIMGQGNRLYAFHPGRDAEWTLIADYGAEPFSDITRVAVSPQGDRLAFVARRPDSP